MDIDDALNKAGSWGKYQILLNVLITMAGIPNAFLATQFVFAHYEPSHHCKFSDAVVNVTMNGTKQSEKFLDFALPEESDSIGKMARSSCKMYNRNYSMYAFQEWTEQFNDTDEQIACNNGWVFHLEQNQMSAVAEFSMVCDDASKPSFVLSMFMAGMAASSISDALADKVGRRPVFLASCITQLLSMIFLSLSWDFTSYCIAAFLCGTSSLVNYLVAFIVVTEMTDVKWRNFVTICVMYSYTFGYCLTPLIAYFLQSWLSLLWVLTAVSAGLYLPTLWLFPESARWLTQEQRIEEAVALLKRIARMNGNERRFDEALKDNGNQLFAKEVPQVGAGEIIRVLFRSGIAGRCLSVYFSWFVVSMGYYGIAFYSTSFSDDRFLNVFYAAVTEFPAYLFSLFVVQVFGRPRTLFLSLTIAAMSNITLPFITLSGLKTAISILGKGAVSVGFHLAYLLGSEVAPTLQRSASLAFCSISARISAVITPVFMLTGKIHPFIPNGVMAAVGMMCAGMVIFLVPETKQVSMPDTVEEARSNKRIYGFRIFKNFDGDETKIHKRGRQESPGKNVLL